ncbi:Ankyrin repeat protein, putative [Theileria annulata]|uniref:Ankyrin repeat protein, putative n=1 Tax=Theileria annulata TaxID=5874 RepID=Q4UH61_THEAN|nr:Ankyrin repeat protein, putative [Theileria annulata]CAI73578.1 Ankyrin repeat protein, putative [Theileria annulata]|eukprot:XP_954255.1 Ankyrin repeat protein, putative [Theileria annulata]
MANIEGLSDYVKKVFEACFSGTLSELKESVNRLLLADSPDLKDEIEKSNSKKRDEVILTSFELSALEYIRDSKQRCVSHIAAAGGNLEILNTLLTASPNLAHIEDENNENSLFYLIRSIITNSFESDMVSADKLDKSSSLEENRIDCLILLIGLCGINNMNKFGLSPLHVATELGSYQICKILLENNANVNVCSKSFNTPLSIAVIKSHTILVDLFLEHGADPNIISVEDKGDDNSDSDKSIPPPLVYCSSVGNTGLVKKLLENGADPNICDSQGWTPLHCASESGYLSVCKLLIEYNADANIVCKKKNAYILAVMNGHDKVAEYLKEFTNESDTFEFLHKSETENELNNNEVDCPTDELDFLRLHDSEELTDEEMEKIKRLVKETRDCGKELVGIEDYTNATNCYTKGLSLCPDLPEFNELKSILYSNRSFTNLKLKNLNQSLRDAKQAVKFNPEWSKAYLRLANVYKEKGETVDYLHNLFQAFVRDSKNSELKRRFQSEFNKHRKS